MPSETPRMPGENYRSLLRHGESRGLGLQAGEVAWYPNDNDLDARAKRYAKRISIIAFVVTLVAGFIGFGTAL